jgi:hypothetical protein
MEPSIGAEFILGALFFLTTSMVFLAIAPPPF